MSNSLYGEQPMIIKASYKEELDHNVEGMVAQGYKRIQPIRCHLEFGDIYFSQKIEKSKA